VRIYFFFNQGKKRRQCIALASIFNDEKKKTQTVTSYYFHVPKYWKPTSIKSYFSETDY